MCCQRKENIDPDSSEICKRHVSFLFTALNGRNKRMFYILCIIYDRESCFVHWVIITKNLWYYLLYISLRNFNISYIRFYFWEITYNPSLFVRTRPKCQELASPYNIDKLTKRQVMRTKNTISSVDFVFMYMYLQIFGHGEEQLICPG